MDQNRIVASGQQMLAEALCARRRGTDVETAASYVSIHETLRSGRHGPPVAANDGGDALIGSMREKPSSRMQWPIDSGLMSACVRAHPWSETPLGPVETWPARLKGMVDVILASPMVSSVVCGPERIIIYNDAAAALYGDRHPAALGRPLGEVFPEGYATVAALYDRVFQGETVQELACPVNVRGDGMRFFDAYLSPVRDDHGRIAYAHMCGFDISQRLTAEAERDEHARQLRDSEERLQLALDAAELGTWDLDLTTGMSGAHSGRHDRIFGYSEPVLEWGQQIAEQHVVEEDRPFLRAAFARALETGVLSFDARVRWPDGSVHWVRSWGRTYYDSSKRPVRMAGVVADISERKQAETALQDSEARFRGLVEGWAQAVWETDVAGIATADSPSWRSYTGQLPGEALYFGWAKAIHPDDRADAEQQWRETVRTRRNLDAEYRLRHAASGMWRWTNVRAVPITNPNGAVRKWVGMNIDINDRRDAQERLRASEARQVFLLRLTDALGPLADPTEIQRTSCRLLGEHLCVHGVSFAELDGDDFILRAGWREDAAPFMSQGAIASFGRTFMAGHRHGETIAVNDVATDSRFDEAERANYCAAGIAAFAAAILRRNGSGIAGFGAHSRKPRAWTEPELALICDVAERVWVMTERARAEKALRDSEERLRRVLEIGTVGVTFFDFEGGIADANDTFLRMVGFTRDELQADKIRYDALTPPDWVWKNAETLAELKATGQSTPFEKEYLRKDGSRIWIYCAGMRLPDGTAVEFTIDVTDRKRAEAARRKSETRLQVLMEKMPQLVWRATDAGQWTWASPQWIAYTGQTEPESYGLGWLDPVHLDDRASVKAAWAVAESTGRLDVEHRIYDVSEQRYRWIQTRAAPGRNEIGAIVEWLGTSTDVDDMRALRERQQVMVAELQHRTRNLIAVLQSVANETLRTSDSLDSFRTAFNDRLLALSRVQGLLSQSASEPITIGALLHMEFDALGPAVTGNRVVLDGPKVPLRKSAVQTLALALHELATNARKYGALATPEGRLRVVWHTRVVDGSGMRLVLEWVENVVGSSIQPSNARRGGGYGRKLIEQALPYALDAETRYELNSQGVRCMIDLSLAKAGQQESDDV